MEIESKILTILLDQGPVVAVLVAFIVWQQKGNKIHVDNLQNQQTSLIGQLQQERLAYIAKSDAHIQECDRDRQSLREELVRLTRLFLTRGRPDDECPRDPPTVRDIRTQLSVNTQRIEEQLKNEKRT